MVTWQLSIHVSMSISQLIATALSRLRSAHKVNYFLVSRCKYMYGHCHAVTLSHCHIVTPSHCHSVTLSRYHIITTSIRLYRVEGMFSFSFQPQNVSKSCCLLMRVLAVSDSAALLIASYFWINNVPLDYDNSKQCVIFLYGIFVSIYLYLFIIYSLSTQKINKIVENTLESKTKYMFQ